ncbi:MAG TPA: tetratricopeptide repeat protein [Pyrinomonadaceae bacterium]
MPHNPRYEFGPFQLDPSNRVLTRAGEIISLTPKATDLLIALVSNAGQLVDKNRLLREIWPDTFVEEANLTQNIFTVRRALGDNRTEPKYVETVARRGYRFVGQVKLICVLKNESTTWQNSRLAATEAIRPVVAVLPFLNVTDEPDLEHLANSLTDNIINSLSRLSTLRVMSRSVVLPYGIGHIDPQQAGKELNAHIVIVGKLSTTPSGVYIKIEMVDASTGWQLWGENFDSQNKDVPFIHDTITHQVLNNLELKLPREEKSPGARYTEKTDAYKLYIEGRYHWGNYTHKEMERAILHFNQAITLDPNYALAYTGIIDCYLRLATNYFPPERGIPSFAMDRTDLECSVDDSNPNVRLRFEWDWKAAERELRRANELQTNYPSAYQWYAAYKTAQQLYEQTCTPELFTDQSAAVVQARQTSYFPSQIRSLGLTANEQVQVYCAISRDQIDAGNYEAACQILKPWWSFGRWPVLEGLNQSWCADLLFTCGELAGCVASTLQIPQGQRHGEELLNGSIALLQQLGFRRRAAEARIELALCYYRQGLFGIGRSNLLRVLQELDVEDSELRALALIRLAILERHAGRPQDALSWLTDAMKIVELSGPWATGRCHLELASTYKDLAISEFATSYFDAAREYYHKALLEFAAVGNYRYVGIVENNIGFLLLSLGLYQESEGHLLRSRSLFEGLRDTVRAAQVNETLARLYFATERFNLARDAIKRAVGILELTDAEALFAEALTTNGLINSRMGNRTEAKKSFDAAYRVAERCGDREGAGRAIITMVEEFGPSLDDWEKLEIANHLRAFLLLTQQTALRIRVEKCLTIIAA